MSNALSVECPRCMSPAGEPCRTSEGQERSPHRRRERAVDGAADGAAGRE
ncbi:zinc finger domain-containing protein [Cellulomonas composti]